MNLTDLVAELDSRAREVRTTPSEARLAGIRRRRRARRARAAAGIAAAGVAAGVLGVAVLPGADRDRAVRPAWRQTFDPDDAGDPLVASRQGTGRELVLRFAPRDTDLAMTAYCLGTPASGTPLATVTVNGRLILEGECRPDAHGGLSAYRRADGVAENRALWAEAGVVPGRESVVRIAVTGGGRVDEVGVGFYERSGPRVTSDGIRLRQRIAVGGRDYRLDRYRTAPASERELSFDGTGPGVVMAGLEGSATRLRVRMDGRLVSQGDVAGLGTTTAPAGRSTTVVTVEGPAKGALLVAYYVPDR